jgi:hypothetical protein
MAGTHICVALHFFLQVGLVEFALQEVEAFQRLADISV